MVAVDRVLVMSDRAIVRLSRLLTMVPWIASQRDGVPIAQVCARFGMSQADVIKDIDTAMMVGVYPFTPDTLIDAWADETRVYVQFAPTFTRPLRLSADEAIRLLAAARALLSLPGVDRNGPLARAARKLEMGLDPDQRDRIEIDMGAVDDATYFVFQQAIELAHQVEIAYGHPDGEVQSRVIEPIGLFSRSGTWYASAWCHRAKARRIFRLDRVVQAQLRNDPYTHEHSESVEQIRFGEEFPLVTLAVNPQVAWMFDAVPVVSRDHGGEQIRIALRVASREWLDRLLVQLGPNGMVVDEPADFAARASAQRYAQTLLANYE